jgi:uncharacterized protein (TIGR02421 family)
MQNLTLSEIIHNIENGICFEARCHHNFEIKILEYVPYVCAAIHNGHQLRSELESQCMLSEQERYFEEDPFTGDFIKSLPITLIGSDSRFEYDLNRTEKECIYEEAWGKKVWNTPLSDGDKEISLQKHRDFYRITDALIAKLEKDFGSVIVYDIHSYNYQRHEKSFTFNIGIENIDKKRFNKIISYWKTQLQAIKIRKVNATVSVNHLFYGRGYFLRHITERFNNTLVLATEVKKVFMDELTGQAFPVVIQNISKGLKNAILENSKYFINTYSQIHVKRRSSLLNSDLQPELIKLDKQLFRLARNFELLSFVNPINIESEKKRFFKHNFIANPIFRYKPLTINPFEFKSKIYSLNVAAIDDIHIRQVYADIIDAYANKADILAHLGSEKFLYNSLAYFGEPSPGDIANANFLLYCHELSEFQNMEMLDIKEVSKLFKSEGTKYGFEYKVNVVPNIASDVLVLNAKKTLLIKKNARFTETRLKALLDHEVGVHMVTTMNAQMQPLNFLRLGLPRNTYTQEGLAVVSEMLGGNLTITRLQELGLRVLAVDSMTDGKDFKTTYQYLLETYKPDPDKLFYLVTRVYRGGGFTKDYLYLRGFRKVLQLLANKENISNLFLGKTTHHYLPILNELVDRGILNAPLYKCPVFESPIETDPILKYLTDSIK